MKKENKSFFANFFGAKSSAAKQETSVILTSYSQPHVLKQKMEEKKMTHGERVVAHLSPVRLERSFSKAILYFCPLKKIEVLNTISNGDGGHLPSEATIEGFSIPKNYEPGFYRIYDVEITSNGTMQVKATKKTRWEKIES